MTKVGLILEGGGFRGIYTAGVLDFFLDKGIKFQDIYGVSAGACNSLSYISGQRGRNLDVHLSYCGDSRYAGMRNYLREGSMFGDFMFSTVPEQLKPFDNDSFVQSGCRLTAVATDCATGRPAYLPIQELPQDINAVRASCSLPFISKMVHYKGQYLLDGGVADAIPIARSISDGNIKNVVIRTRMRGYRKTSSNSSLHHAIQYPFHPALLRALSTRALRYNHTLDFIETQRRAGNAFVIAPSKNLRVDRLEKNRTKLNAQYMLGYMDAKHAYDELIALCAGAQNVTLNNKKIAKGRKKSNG